ncbi:hypothetical protein CALVIDRAFT_550335 [Calocera viscosa TUFC12733]|uniref:RRM domain-containing protein n=1 Tax=Calocera viscosa (strain TUFC12733) TaxID=1330018 RepID=A0A167KHS8_CALVF|nr:hypothetical protein CALVIDRAFT_550335 [Calocera viscosa TUFC12733]
MAHRDSRVVFVGNIPYGMTEEALIEVFRTVGPVVGFRLVFDRETGKPKGYGFCEFPDHETAMSAVRNLHGYEVQGRPLRVDIAESDPMVEGKTTQHGEIKDRNDGPGGGHGSRWGPPKNDFKNDFANFMNDLPSGVNVPLGKSSLDLISQALASIPHPQLMQTLSQMKGYVANYPDRARALLVAHPQLSYAFFQAMLMNKIVDPAILERMLKATTQAAAPPPAPAPVPPLPQPYSYPPAMQPAAYAPPPQSYYGMPPSQQMPQSMPPPPVPPAAAAQQPLPADQRAMLMQVLSLSQDQVNALPPTERAAIMQLRSQFAGVLQQ